MAYSIESYTTLKSIMSSFKICFQNLFSKSVFKTMSNLKTEKIDDFDISTGIYSTVLNNIPFEKGINKLYKKT